MTYVPQANIRHSSQDADDWFRLLEDRVTGKNKVMDRRRKDNDKKVKVAILDSGIDASHPQFSKYPMDGGMSRFRGFGDHNCRDWTGSSATHDRVGHGTHAAALVLKVAPKAELYIAKIFNSKDGDANTPHHVAEVSTTSKFMSIDS